MSEHLDLFGLLRGELDNAGTIAAGAHLESCATCREELVDAVVGHGLLAGASRTLGNVVGQPALPPPSLAKPRRRRGALLAVAAAVVFALGVSGTVWWRSDDSPGSGPGIEAALTPLSATVPGEGSVRMVEHDGGTRMTLAVHDLPRAGAGEFYYAWLLDPTSNKMLALGLVDPSGGATFEVDDRLVAAYSAVDVSLEADDGDPAHSVTSVLRGAYEPNQITTTAERKHS
jgi:hypothetical protein